MQWLPWPDAAVASGCATVATPLLAGRRRPAAVAAWTRELAVMFALYSLWQFAGSFSLGHLAGAQQRGASILRWERWLALPRESAVQATVLPHHSLVRVFNVYYVGLHVAVTGIVLIWLFARHRSCYPAIRNTLALATGACLVIALVPVAPPRLVAGSGLVDTGRLVGPTVYPASGTPGMDQLSAMPSVHVAWAVLVAAAVVTATRSRWRWAAVTYPVATVFVVVVTGNHYWADAGAAVALCAVAAVVQSGFRGWSRRDHRQDWTR